jgi:hypothetical protein
LKKNDLKTYWKPFKKNDPPSFDGGGEDVNADIFACMYTNLGLFLSFSNEEPGKASSIFGFLIDGFGQTLYPYKIYYIPLTIDGGEFFGQD